MTPRDLCRLWRDLLRSGASSSDMLKYLPDLDAALATPRRPDPSRRCEVQGCGARHYALGFCGRHWRQARAGVDPHANTRLPAGVARPEYTSVEPSRPVGVPDGWDLERRTSRG